MTTHAKAVALVARILRALRARPWLTARELCPEAEMPPNTMRAYLRRMISEGLVRCRHRVLEPDADGNLPKGHKPREYRAASGWGGLA